MNNKESELYNVEMQKDFFNNILNIIEEYLNYIISYSSLTKEYMKNINSIQKQYEEKIKITRNELKNEKKYHLSHFFLILNAMPKINSLYLENTKFFIKNMDISINSLQKYIEEKKILMNKMLDNLNNDEKDLLIKINDIEKEKNIYFNSLSATEKIVTEYYMNKLKIEESSKNKSNSDLKNLFILNNSIEEEMNKSINESKKIEKNYKLAISNSKIFKKAFIDTSNVTNFNIESISNDLILEIKQLVQQNIILLKNCYAIPLSEIDNNLSKLILNKEKENKILDKKFEKSNLKIKDKYQIISKKYPLQIFNKKNPFTTFEDDLEEISYIENDLLFYTAKTMFSSFTLIEDNYNIDFELEEGKRTTKKIISNLLLNIEKINIQSNLISFNENNDEKELKYVHENDIELLYMLLDKHCNQMIFLQIMSQFRTSGKFCMPNKVFEIIGKCLRIIIDTIKKEEDYHYAKNVIIISQTYFILKDNDKYYLHNLIKKHKLFSNMKFWEITLECSIKNEILKNQKNHKKANNEINNIDLKEEKEKANDIEGELHSEKYSDIAFGQIASIVNVMIDLDINIKDIRNFIEPKEKLYKLSKNHIKNIELVIENKYSNDFEQNFKDYNDSDNNDEIDNEINTNTNNKEKTNEINNK